jgi:hypothetical protein
MSFIGLTMAIFLGLLMERWASEGIKTVLYFSVQKKLKSTLEKELLSIMSPAGGFDLETATPSKKMTLN